MSRPPTSARGGRGDRRQDLPSRSGSGFPAADLAVTTRRTNNVHPQGRRARPSPQARMHAAVPGRRAARVRRRLRGPARTSCTNPVTNTWRSAAPMCRSPRPTPRGRRARGAGAFVVGGRADRAHPDLRPRAHEQAWSQAAAIGLATGVDNTVGRGARRRTFHTGRWLFNGNDQHQHAPAVPRLQPGARLSSRRQSCRSWSTADGKKTGIGKRGRPRCCSTTRISGLGDVGQLLPVRHLGRPARQTGRFSRSRRASSRTVTDVVRQLTGDVVGPEPRSASLQMFGTEVFPGHGVGREQRERRPRPSWMGSRSAGQHERLDLDRRHHGLPDADRVRPTRRPAPRCSRSSRTRRPAAAARWPARWRSSPAHGLVSYNRTWSSSSAWGATLQRPDSAGRPARPIAVMGARTARRARRPSTGINPVQRACSDHRVDPRSCPTSRTPRRSANRARAQQPGVRSPANVTVKFVQTSDATGRIVRRGALAPRHPGGRQQRRADRGHRAPGRSSARRPTPSGQHGFLVVTTPQGVTGAGPAWSTSRRPTRHGWTAARPHPAGSPRC